MRQIIELALAPIAIATLPLLVEALIKGSVLLLIAASAAVALRRASAATRNLIWVLALGAILLLPAISAVGPQWHVLPSWLDASTIVLLEDSEPASDKRHKFLHSKRLPATNDAWPQSIEPHRVKRTEESRSPAVAVPIPNGPVNDPHSLRNRQSNLGLPSGSENSHLTENRADGQANAVAQFASVIVWVWAAGVVLLCCRILLSGIVLAQLGRRARTVDDERATKLLAHLCRQLAIWHPVQLLDSSRREMPIVWGIKRPRILLPGDWPSWSDERLRAVLLHELAHIRRHDALSQLLVQLACVVHWFNPLVWLAAWRVRVECERACDDLVLGSGLKASDYAEHLLEIATGYTSGGIAAVSSVGMARKFRLESRLLAILNKQLNRAPLTRRVLGVSLVAIACVATPLAMMHGQEQEKGSPAFGANAEQLEATKPKLRLFVPELQDLNFATNPDERSDDAEPESKKSSVIGTVANYFDKTVEPVAGTKLVMVLRRIRGPARAQILRTESDADGRFRFEFPTAWLGPGSFQMCANIWAQTPDGRLTCQWLHHKHILTKLPRYPSIYFRSPLVETVVAVVDSQGVPVAGARVEFGRLANSGFHLNMEPIPAEFEALLSSVTNEAGTVRCRLRPSSDALPIRVTADGFGQQTRFVDAETTLSGKIRVELRPTGHLKGRLISERPELARGVRLHIATRPKNEEPAWPRPGRRIMDGMANVVTDQHGRFEVPAIANGQIFVRAAIDLDQPFRLREPRNVGVTTGRTTDMELTLQRAVPVSALVLRKTTREPVSQAEVYVADQVLFTGRDGRCTSYVLAGEKTRAVLLWVPGVLVWANHKEIVEPKIPDRAGGFQFAPFEVVPAVVRRGRIVNERGRPVAGVRVYAQNAAGVRRLAKAPSDRNGEFEIRIGAGDEFPKGFTGHGKLTVRDAPAKLIDKDPLTLQFPNERRAIQGIWKAVAITEGGEKKAIRQTEETRLIISGSHLCREAAGNTLEVFHCEVDPTTEPGTITLIAGKKRMPGIYRLGTDELTICVNRAAGDLPKQFLSPSDSEIALFVLKREDASHRTKGIKNDVIR